MDSGLGQSCGLEPSGLCLGFAAPVTSLLWVLPFCTPTNRSSRAPVGAMALVWHSMAQQGSQTSPDSRRVELTLPWGEEQQSHIAMGWGSERGTVVAVFAKKIYCTGIAAFNPHSKPWSEGETEAQRV